MTQNRYKNPSIVSQPDVPHHAYPHIMHTTHICPHFPMTVRECTPLKGGLVRSGEQRLGDHGRNSKIRPRRPEDKYKNR